MSHLLQMRGLKQKKPFSREANYPSHLLQMRGLKRYLACGEYGSKTVASFTDAWIETFDLESVEHHDTVASFTDAWIETAGFASYP